MRGTLIAAAVFAAVEIAGAQEQPTPSRPLPDLKHASPAQQVVTAGRREARRHSFRPGELATARSLSLRRSTS
jgi:hypothetical protein